MLDNTTKRRIDNARDILVGKVPDPKAQVEQITTALIYKFMFDMDQESVELGGEPSFFVGEYNQYAWSKLMDKRLGGHARLDLYVRAITSMSQNPHIPQLFRDIFKDAFLPYRDPETLNLFLKEIDVFTYDHSERLGDAFEYLLSILGSQGAAGQFRTPRHIIDFIVAAVAPTKTDTILDPACGTAGFLISAYKYILASNQDTPFTPDERQRLTQNFVGYDIAPEMVRLSLVNMYLHKFPQPTIYEYDTLTSEERWDDTFDVILANPPFMTPKGGIRPNNRFSVQTNRSEVLFVDYIAEHLNPSGRAGVIIPEGIIFQSSNAYKALRKMLVDEYYLWAVVSLPAGVFNPYSGVKTSILLMDKTLARHADNVLFIDVKNDGYDLGAQRRDINQDDLPQALEILRQFQTDPALEFDTPLALTVPKTRLAEDGDFSLTGGRYRVLVDYSNLKWPLVSLGDIAVVISGQSPPGEFYNQDGVGTPFYQGKTEFTDIYIDPPSKWTTQVTRLAEANDILMSVRAPVGPVNMTTNSLCIGRGLAAIRPNPEKADVLYIFYILKLHEDRIRGNAGAAFASINRKDIQAIQIPLPPLDIQRAIVAELKGYQKIGIGARQVIANYKPHIKVDPDWPLVELVSLLSNSKESIDPKNQEGIVQYIGLENIVSNSGKISGDTETEISTIKSAKKIFKPGDILYGRLRPNLNKVYLAVEDGICSTDIFVLRGDVTKVISGFYSDYLRSERFNAEVMKGISGAQLPRVSWSYFSKIKIPYPPFKTQEKITARLAEEKELIESTRQLIKLYSKKTEEIISEVWRETSEG